ncbi:MAG: HPF/RaiA family ribosome-associated protein [Candidatus Latescibacterota bacterium]
MQIALSITYRNVQKSEEIEKLISDKVIELEQICSCIIRCRVYIEKVRGFEKSGNPYNIRVELKVPQEGEIVVLRSPNGLNIYDPLSTGIRNAFLIARRKVIEYGEPRRGIPKAPHPMECGAVVERIFKQEGFGFLRTVSGREIYFNRDSVPQNNFEKMEMGVGVWYVERESEKGPWASIVEILEPGA